MFVFSPKNVPPPAQPLSSSEPEDEFLILEEDPTSWFSLTSKIHKKRRPSLNSYTEKSSLESKSPPKAQENEQKSKQPSGSAGGQNATEKAKTKKKEKKSSVKEAGNYLDMLCSLQDPPEGVLTEPEQPIQENHQAEEPPQSSGGVETDEGEAGPSKVKRAREPADMKRPKSSVKVGNQNRKKSRTKPSKPVRKTMQGPEVGQESEEAAGTEDPGSSSGEP